MHPTFPRALARRARSATIGAALGAALVVGGPLLAADAHVRVAPDQAAPDSYAVLTFRVPTESATASTVRLEVDLPADHPFGSISTQPVPGWTAKVTTGKLPKPVETKEGATITTAPTKIVWTADGKGLPPGQFEQFPINAGPVPETGSVELPAIQTYSDGSVVKWNQATPASGEEPEHPAPTVYITDAPPATGPTTAPGSGATITATRVVASDDSGSDGVAVGLGVGGLVLGAAGLVTGLVALRRSGARAAGGPE
jgi:uncharacterized protein YcnI